MFSLRIVHSRENRRPDYPLRSQPRTGRWVCANAGAGQHSGGWFIHLAGDHGLASFVDVDALYGDDLTSSPPALV